MKRALALLVALALALVAAPAAPALAATSGNPILPGDHPDPSIELFNGAYYVYTTASGGSTDAPGRYFHAWRSTDLTNWVDAGVVLDWATVGWASTDTRTWAPDMVYRNGKYYFYTAIATSVGVAVCQAPSNRAVTRAPRSCRGSCSTASRRSTRWSSSTTTARRTCTSAAPPAAAPWASSGSTPTWSPSAAR